MTYLKTSKISPPPINLPKVAGEFYPTPTRVVKTAPHLRYISGKRANLWKELIKRGLLDPYGNITPFFASYPMPHLNKKEVELIQRELFRPFTIALGEEKTLKVSMGGLLRAFLFRMSKEKKDFRVNTLRLIGGYVSYVLFTQTDYAKRVFQALKIEDLYDDSLFKKTGVALADIDLRMHIQRNRSASDLFIPSLGGYLAAPLSGENLHAFRDLVIEQIAVWYREKYTSEEKVEETIFNQTFETLCTVSTSSNLFQVMNLKENPMDWVMFSHLGRPCVFTVDDLFLPIESLLNTKVWTPISPQSFRRLPLESFFHYILGLTRADNPSTIDEKGWFRYISWVVKGNTSSQLRAFSGELPLEMQLYKSMYSRWMHHDPTGVGRFNEELSKWLKKHHPEDPLAQLLFVLNTCRFLQGRIKAEDMQTILTVQLSSLPAIGVTKQLKILLLDKKLPVEALFDFLQLNAFLIHTRKNPTHRDVRVEVGTDNFDHPVLQLHINTRTLQLSCDPINALKRLNQFQQQHPKLFLDVEEELNRLFITLCPPSATDFMINEDIAVNLGVNLCDVLVESLPLMDSSSTFLTYLGIVFLIGNANLAKEATKGFVERHCTRILASVEEKQEVVGQLEVAVGVGSIPDIESSNFEEQWIQKLFEPERKSQETAVSLWKEMVTRDRGVAFSLELIRSLAHTQPEHALTLFTYLNIHDKLAQTPSEVVSLILECREIIQEKENISSNHERLLDYLAQTLLQFLTHEGFQKPKNSKPLAKGIIECAKWAKKRNESDLAFTLASIGVRRSYFRHNSLYIKVKLDQLFSSEMDRKQRAQARKVLKQAASKKLLKPKTLFLYLVRYFEMTSKIPPNPELLSCFIQTLKSAVDVDLATYERASLLYTAFLNQTSIPLEDRLNLIDTLCQKAPSLCPKIIDTVLAFCFVAPRDKENCTVLGNWLVNTTYFEYFDTSQRDGFQLFLTETFSDLVTFGKAEMVDRLVVRYADDLQSVEPSQWIQFFCLIDKQCTERMLPLFQLVESRGLLTTESALDAYQTVYRGVLGSLWKRKDVAILTFVKDQEKHRKIFSKISDSETALFSYAYLLQGASEFVSKDESMIAALQVIYQDFLKMFEEVLAKEYARTYDTSIYYALKAEIDFCSVQLLIQSKLPDNHKRARGLIAQNLSASYPAAYRAKNGKLINLLAEQSLLSELDEALEFLDVVTIRGIDFGKVTAVLNTDLTIGRAYRALQLCRFAMLEEAVLSSPRWKSMQRYLQMLIHADEPKFEVGITRTIALISANFSKHIASLGMTFSAQFISVCLSHFAQIREPDLLSCLKNQIELVLSNSLSMYKSRGGREIFEVFPRALANLAHFDEKEFTKYAGQYWKSAVVKNSKVKKQAFIKVMLYAVNSERSGSKILLEVARTYLNAIVKDPKVKLSIEEGGELLKLYRETYVSWARQ